MQHFKFENWRTGELENSIFDVMNRAFTSKCRGIMEPGGQFTYLNGGPQLYQDIPQIHIALYTCKLVLFASLYVAILSGISQVGYKYIEHQIQPPILKLPILNFHYLISDYLSISHHFLQVTPKFFLLKNIPSYIVQLF